MDQALTLDRLYGSDELLLQFQRLGKMGHIVADAKSDRVQWSESLFEMRKVPRRDYFTRAESIAFIHPEDRVKVEAERALAVAGRKSSFTMEMRVLRGDGSEGWERSTAQPLYDDAGEFTGQLIVIHDITESKRDAARIQEQQETLRTLFDGIGDCVLLTHNGRFLDCNTAAQKMFRCEREQIVGQTPAFISPERQPDGQSSTQKANEKIDAALRGERQQFEWRHKRFDGSEFDAEVTLNRVDIPGESYFFGVVRDISERKRAESALKAAHDKFAGAFESSANAMIVGFMGVAPGDGVILDANRAADRTFGIEHNALIGRTLTQTGLLSDMPAAVDIRRSLLEAGAVHNYPVRLHRPDGTVFDAEVSGSRFLLDGRTHFLLIISDVTERLESARKIENLNASLEASLKQLRDITDNVPVLITYQDAEGRFQFVNKTTEQWLSLSAEQLLGKTVHETLPKSYVEATQTIRNRRTYRSNDLARLEMTVPYPDGISRTVFSSYIPDISSDGVVRGTYTFAVDITERKAAEEQLHQSQKLQAIGKLTGGVAHDFNNLLAVILGNLELANEKLKGSDEAVRRLLAPALRSAERGVTLTRSLLAFARQQPLEPVVLDLTGLMRDMTNLLRRTVPANIEIEFVGSAGLWKCEADPGQLQNALLNLVVNARDAMPDGGKLTVETSNTRLDDDYAQANAEVKPGQYVMIAVSDTGSGMSPEVLARVFEPFYTTKGLGHGTGLGLSMVYGFAKQSGGHVAIYSEPGDGTTVRIYLPRWLGRGGDATAPKMETISAANNEKLLVVEDDEDVRFITVTMLRSLGYNVLEASNGVAALAALKAAPDVVLLVTDVVLAGTMNGKKVALEAQALQPAIKVLYMSGYTENAIVHQGRLDQGVHFIQKPFRKQDLAAKVRSVLEQPTD
jgi:PAS domain S-box-containing protein